jgi:N6-adenosine-specific RNA methylase IME4
MHAHSVANLFPMMNNDEYAALVADIHQHGQREPIWLLDGQIIDGRNRWQACRDLGIQPITRNYTGATDTASLIAFVVSLNLKRRHLNSGQLAIVALDIEKTLAQANPPGRPSGEEMCQRIDTFTAPLGRNAEQAAAIVGTNRQYVSDAKNIAQQAPDLLNEVRTGAITLPEAKKLVSLPEEDRAAVLGKVATGEAKNVNKALAELRLENKRAVAMRQPSGVYNVLYADPPWEYDNTGVHGAADHHYPTMPLDDISSLLDDQRIAVADNAVLFLWATNPFLQDAFYVINSWGFEYKTNMAWIKTDLVKPGSGFYVRGRHELLLICTRGSFTPLDAHISPPIGSVISAPVGDHSSKPDDFYTVIERLYPGCNYLELFARRQRDGWEGWGYDSPR